MASPVGHTLVGVALARRLGVRGPLGIGAAVVAASLPDIDVIYGMAMHRDPWKVHRQSTHTAGFALAAGMLAGFAGVLSAGSHDGERDLVADVVTGAIIVGSHLVLDRDPIPYLPADKSWPRAKKLRTSAINWLIDAAVYGAIARIIWPRRS